MKNHFGFRSETERLKSTTNFKSPPGRSLWVVMALVLSVLAYTGPVQAGGKASSRPSNPRRGLGRLMC